MEKRKLQPGISCFFRCCRTKSQDQPAQSFQTGKKVIQPTYFMRKPRSQKERGFLFQSMCRSITRDGIDADSPDPLHLAADHLIDFSSFYA
jgi:hypothetical protein